MSRATNPTYLGGIGLMLEVARVCPRCGKRLPDSPAASSRHMAGNGCRPAVYAALPDSEAKPAEDPEIPLTPAGRRIRDFEAPTGRSRSVSFVDLPPAVDLPRESPRSLAVSWLRPPDLGEVL